MKSSIFFAIVAACTFSLMVSEIAQAQPGGGERGRFQFRGMMDSDVGLLMRDEIREEIGVTEEQMEILQEIQRETRDTMREMFRNRGNGEEFDWEEMRKKMEEMNSKLEEEIEGVLEPFQMKRLKQIGLQTRQRRGGTNALESIADDLGIDENQMEELRTLADEARKEYEEAIAKAREAMEKKILGGLTSEQRSKYEEMMGDTFEWNRDRGRERSGRRDRGENERPNR